MWSLAGGCGESFPAAQLKMNCNNRAFSKLKLVMPLNVDANIHKRQRQLKNTWSLGVKFPNV